MKKYLFLIAVIMPIFVSAQSNSQWRSEGRDGVYNETGLLKAWPTDGPKLLWKYEGLGAGFASPAVANGKVYVTGMSDDNLILYVFDLTGKLLNKKTVGKERTAQYPGSRCTVVVNDGMLYIGNSVGQFYCLDEATLNVVWKKELFTDFDGRQVNWGWVEMPLIVDEKIFLTPGGVKDNMVALNKKTGALIWSSPGRGTPSSYCSPLYIGDQQIPMVVTWVAPVKPGGFRAPNDNELMALNANTGELIWSVKLTSENTINPNTPLYSDGMILASTGYGGGAWQLRLKDGGKAVEQVWHNTADNLHYGVIKAGNYIYTTAQNNRGFYCIDWKTGETKYRHTNSYPTSAMIFADGMLYVYNDNGRMNLIRPNPDKYDLVSSFEIAYGTDQHWAHPVISQGVLYIRHGDALMAYQIKL